MLSLYRKIWSLTARGQVLLIVLPIAISALAAIYLQYQKDIINGLIESMDRRELLFMGAQFFGIVVLSSGLKFVVGYRSALLGESVIRDLRTQIVASKGQQSQPKADQAVRRGAFVTMISAEAEEVGRFAGSAITAPLMQIGTLVSVIAFIALTQPLLGALVVVLILLQAAIVLGVQNAINIKVHERVTVLRRATGHIVAEDVRRIEDAVRADFDEIYEARRSIFRLKQTSKFALNAINGLGTAGILVLGGWLVLEGRSDIGTVTADLAGLARIAQPWRELISFFRSLSAVRVKYELLKPVLPH